MLKYYDIIITIIETILNLFMALVLSIVRITHYTTYPSNIKRQIVQVLGNGPSLNADIKNIIEKRDNSDIMVVNSFALTEYYKLLKPEYYVIVDPGFFNNTKDDRIIAVRNNVINSIIDKTYWDIQLFIPYIARHTHFVDELNKNSFIRITFFKNIPIVGGIEIINRLLFRLNFANPLYKNVLIAALFISIKMKYPNIFIWGADHSWHEDFILGEDNYVYTPDKHFYTSDGHSRPFIHKLEDNLPLRVHDEFLILHRIFKTYHTIRYFADQEKINIINMSTKTWIDAFQRK